MGAFDNFRPDFHKRVPPPPSQQIVNLSAAWPVAAPLWYDLPRGKYVTLTKCPITFAWIRERGGDAESAIRLFGGTPMELNPDITYEIQVSGYSDIVPQDQTTDALITWQQRDTQLVVGPYPLYGGTVHWQAYWTSLSTLSTAHLHRWTTEGAFRIGMRLDARPGSTDACTWGILHIDKDHDIANDGSNPTNAIALSSNQGTGYSVAQGETPYFRGVSNYSWGFIAQQMSLSYAWTFTTAGIYRTSFYALMPPLGGGR